MKKEKGSKYSWQRYEDKEKRKELDKAKKRKGGVGKLIDLCSPFLPVCLATRHFIPNIHYKDNSRSEPEEE